MKGVVHMPVWLTHSNILNSFVQLHLQSINFTSLYKHCIRNHICVCFFCFGDMVVQKQSVASGRSGSLSNYAIGRCSSSALFV